MEFLLPFKMLTTLSLVGVKASTPLWIADEIEIE
jgi:hypothetical protein